MCITVICSHKNYFYTVISIDLLAELCLMLPLLLWQSSTEHIYTGNESRHIWVRDGQQSFFTTDEGGICECGNHSLWNCHGEIGYEKKNTINVSVQSWIWQGHDRRAASLTEKYDNMIKRKVFESLMMYIKVSGRQQYAVCSSGPCFLFFETLFRPYTWLKLFHFFHSNCVMLIIPIPRKHLQWYLNAVKDIKTDLASSEMCNSVVCSAARPAFLYTFASSVWPVLRTHVVMKYLTKSILTYHDIIIYQYALLWPSSKNINWWHFRGGWSIIPKLPFIFVRPVSLDYIHPQEGV